ncbi:RHS repeat protein [Salmonella enterica]|nr:RHS repeat protein [Salmonella enterica subsp. salamae]ECL1291703.1 RHS repeat protein [Salmonella enterica]ECJ2730454.1 RHS repeat protein [Salmonella enterica subsp. salamae]EEA0958342.1 RHS repeat protein [Salmonella enterica]EGH5313083.1 RHS repeat protein [Salmonella enterica]
MVRLVTVQTEQSRIQTIYEPGGFTPLVRVETGTEALATTRPQRSLAEKLRQEGNEDGTEMAFPAELVRHLDRLENELRRNAVSEESRKWLAQCGLTAEQMAEQLDAQTEPERVVHLYHCDHRGLPVALINSEGARDWSAEYDVWGNRLKEDNPQKLAQLIRLPGQQYDDETGLYYNRYRYYNPEQGRYISQDPIGLRGGWNLYTYPLNPVSGTDPLGLVVDAIPWGAATPSAVPPLVPVTGMFMGMTALDVALAGFEADVAVPEPTDAAWPKWVGWGVVIAASAAFTYLTCSSDEDSSEKPEDKNADDGDRGDFTDSGHGRSDEGEMDNGEERPSNIVKLDDDYLKNKGIDGHKLKGEFLGSKAEIKKSDIYRDKDTGQLWIFEKGGKGPGIPTGEYLDK